jgi:stage V sporulation protein AA
MASVKQTLYIKANQSVEVKLRNVTLKDLISMECIDKTIVSKLKTTKILNIPEKGQHRIVVSILKIIECIHKEYPELEIQNMGAEDIIVTYEGEKKKNVMMDFLKTMGVVIISFIGSAFAIMTFNNDVQLTTLLRQIYEWQTGGPSSGFTILELTYSIGLIIGILVFFNHFGKKRFSADPTPIEVEMRLYENDIQTTIVETYSRKGEEICVD